MKVAARKTERNVWLGHMQKRIFYGACCNVGVFSDLFQEQKTPYLNKN